MDIYRCSSVKESESAGNGSVQRVGSGRKTDFMADGWRVFKIMAEFVSGFQMMADAAPAVAVKCKSQD